MARKRGDLTSSQALAPAGAPMPALPLTVLILVVVGWLLFVLFNFATRHMLLGTGAATMWAIVALIVTTVCVASLVGIVVWPYAIAFASLLFGAPTTKWQDATMVTLFVAVLVGFGVASIAGIALAFAADWLHSRRRRRAPDGQQIA